MKPFYQKLAPLPSLSVIFYDEEKPHFTVPWHFHPEIEILYVVKSSGTSYIGDGIQHFTEGEISMIGENVPHWWKSDAKYYNDEVKSGIKAQIIQFKREIFDPNFINLPEMLAIKGLLSRSDRGIRFTGKIREQLGRQMTKIFRKSGINRISEFIILLDMMANAKEYKFHTSPGYSRKINTYDFYRFNKIHEYLILNFTRQITLKDVAGIANMSQTAFCRYFKQHTGKSFLSFLNEIRIGYACKLMIYDNFPVFQASQESGFNNLSHFNVQFKRFTSLTPTEYISAYRKGVPFKHVSERLVSAPSGG